MRPSRGTTCAKDGRAAWTSVPTNSGVVLTCLKVKLDSHRCQHRCLGIVFARGRVEAPSNSNATSIDTASKSAIRPSCVPVLYANLTPASLRFFVCCAAAFDIPASWLASKML